MRNPTNVDTVSKQSSFPEQYIRYNDVIDLDLAYDRVTPLALESGQPAKRQLERRIVLRQSQGHGQRDIRKYVQGLDRRETQTETLL